MAGFFEAESLTEDERKKLEQEVERRIAERMKAGLLTPREIKEIEEMRLKPLPDIQDVQDVYENHLFRKPDKNGPG
jgi:hypothetical protein